MFLYLPIIVIITFALPNRDCRRAVKGGGGVKKKMGRKTKIQKAEAEPGKQATAGWLRLLLACMWGESESELPPPLLYCSR